jgi:glycogen(starch) synthase
MKILVVSNSFPPYHGGGYSLHAYWYASGLAKAGHDVLVLTSKPPTKSAGQYDMSGLKVFRNMQFIGPKESALSVVLKNANNAHSVRSTIGHSRPDIVYHHGNDGLGYNSYIAATESGVPAFTTIGDSWLSQAWTDLRRYDRWCGLAHSANSGKRWLAKLALRRLGISLGLDARGNPGSLSECGCISTHLKDELQRSVPQDKAWKISHTPPMLSNIFYECGKASAVQSMRERPVRRLLFVGRLELMKGVDTAIEILSHIVEQGADARLSLVGEGRPEALKDIAAVIARYPGLDARIDQLGQLSGESLVSAYHSHDVLVAPSRYREGFGMVVAEAMACGLPVVGTANHGAADALIDGSTGFRMEAGDAAMGAERVLCLLEDRELYAEVSRRCFDSAQKYHPTTVIGQLEQKFYRLLAE